MAEKSRTNRPEILAPCGSMESVKAALGCGADAIYLGQRAFNARQNAANFDDVQLRETVALCHRYGVKVYQTLNTLVFDSEFDQLKKCIQFGCDAGVDAFIVQDMGVLKLVSELAPNMRLHASTQMTIHTPEGARFLEQIGIKRAVLARELSLAEIREIHASSSIELEVFVHGALCVCVSGQCYMSGMLGGRSGNRGRCAQPCRLPFAVHGDGAADLSLKDLSAVGLLEELAQAGVSSFKIEGRMKRPEYVAAAVSACVRQRDGKEPDLETLRAVFSRSGFTDGYLTGRRDGKMFGRREKEDVVAAADVMKPLHNLYRTLPQRVGCSMALEVKNGADTKLAICDSDGNQVLVTGAPPQQAVTKPLTAETAQAALSKLGGTPFYLEDLSAEIGEGLMVPGKDLNALRRSGTEQLCAARERARTVSFQDKALSFPAEVPFAGQAVRVRVEKPQQAALVDTRVQEVVFPLRELENAGELERKRAVIELPRVMFGRENQVREQLHRARGEGFRRVLVHNPAQIFLAKEQGFQLSGGFGLNVLNSAALAFYREQGLSDLTLSIEGNLDQLGHIHRSLPIGIIAYGHLPLMITRSCPIGKYRSCAGCNKEGALTDRQGKQFTVRCHDGVREIYNPDCLFLADRRKEISCFDFITLYFTEESAQDVKKIADDYFFGGRMAARYTRGLYYRKV